MRRARIMKKDKSYLMIKISLIMIVFSFVNFYGTDAFFTDSEELSTNINITTGTLDIQLKDYELNTVGDQSYILQLTQTIKSQMIGNFSVKDIGSLSSSLSAKVIVEGPTDVVNLINVSLVDSSGSETLLSENYKPVNSIHNTGNTFGVKIVYTGTLPFNSGDLAVKVELKATQPNDDFNNPKMFSDMQEIRVFPIQIAFEGSGTPIKGAIQLNKNEWVAIDILFEKSNVETIIATINTSSKYYVTNLDENSLKFKINGNFKNTTILITITAKNGEIYYVEHNIQSAD